MGEHLGMHALVLDGEVVAFGEDGRPELRPPAEPAASVGSQGGPPAGGGGPGAVRGVRRALRRRALPPGRPLRRPAGPARGARLLGVQLHDDRVLPRRLGPRRAPRHHRERARRRRGQAARLHLSAGAPRRRMGKSEGGDHAGSRRRRVDRREGRPRGQPGLRSCSEFPERTASTTSARWAPGSTTGPSSRSWSSCGRCARGPIPSAAPSRRPRPRVRTSSVPAWSARSATGSGPQPVGCATRPGAACGPTRRRPTSAASRRPHPTNPTTPARPHWWPARAPSSAKSGLAAGARGRPRAVDHQPGQGALPRDRIHQGTADRLLRPHRPGHAAAPGGTAPHHEALPRRRRGQVLLREARALAQPPVGQDADRPLRAPWARSPTPPCRTCRP